MQRQQQQQQTWTPETEVPSFATGSNRAPLWTPTEGTAKAKAKGGYPSQGKGTAKARLSAPPPRKKKGYPPVPVFHKARAASPATAVEPAEELAPTQSKAFPPSPSCNLVPASWATPQVSAEDQVESYDNADFNFDEVSEALDEVQDEGADAHSPHSPSL